MDHSELIALTRRARIGDKAAIVGLERFALSAGEQQAEALFQFALLHDDTGQPSPFPKNQVEARRLLILAAELGHPMAAYFLGNMYDYGDGGAQDIDKARYWYGLAAIAGIRDAQMHYGRMLEKGRGGSLDLEEAAYWYLQAAQQGDELAAMNLGLLHFHKHLSNSDEVVAVNLFKFAADKLLASAHLQLGELYRTGTIVEAREDLALFYFCVAVELKSEDAWHLPAVQRQQELFENLAPEFREKFIAAAKQYISDGRGHAH